MGCFIERGRVRLEGPRGEDWTARFPEVVAAAKRLPIRQALLDGQVTLVLPDGRTSARALQNAVSGAPRHGLTYFVFDLLHVDGTDLSALPLDQRKSRCAELLEVSAADPTIRYAAHFEADGPTVFGRACELGAGGIVSKRRDQPHRAGRTQDWLESPCPPAGVISVRGVTITRPERMLYPLLGLKKLDLARYYSEVAERMLPYIARRPLTLVRCEKGVKREDGLRTECKFLRHEAGWHRWARAPIQRVQIQEQKKLGEYLVVDCPEALVGLVQGDILEIHSWNSRVDALEKPDRIVFDLDPGASVAWPAVVDAAKRLRHHLARLGLQAWPKLTGGKGLHVVVPFLPERSWDEVFAFARAVAESLERTEPDALTLEFGKRGREQKILVDYKRNHRAAVAVAAYSARARPGASVSTPISWRELAASSTPDAYSVPGLLARMQRKRTDPWKEFWRSRQRLPAVRG
jgi:bifunctional non-homologous end joining protein LigD